MKVLLQKEDYPKGQERREAEFHSSAVLSKVSAQIVKWKIKKEAQKQS